MPAATDKVIVPRGWTWTPIIAWGDPWFRDAPECDVDDQNGAAPSRQFGYGNDFVTLVPTGRDRAALVVTHEYASDELMFRGIDSPADLTVPQLRSMTAAHGLTAVDVRRSGPGRLWESVRGGRHNRLITATTPFRFTGPAAGSTLLRTSADPCGRTARGRVNNCSGGTTPWGTVLLGGGECRPVLQGRRLPAAASTPQQVRERLTRYGVTSGGRGWERVDRRFDVAAEPNEPHRFGWIVEVDPA